MEDTVDKGKQICGVRGKSGQDSLSRPASRFPGPASNTRNQHGYSKVEGWAHTRTATPAVHDALAAVAAPRRTHTRGAHARLTHGTTDCPSTQHRHRLSLATDKAKRLLGTHRARFARPPSWTGQRAEGREGHPHRRRYDARERAEWEVGQGHVPGRVVCHVLIGRHELEPNRRLRSRCPGVKHVDQAGRVNDTRPPPPRAQKMAST